MRNLLALAIIASVVAGCSSSSETPPAAPAGTTQDAQLKGGAGAGKGMSPNDLSVPSGSENAFQPGSKGGG
jgi:hypothetical protein